MSEAAFRLLAGDYNGYLSTGYRRIATTYAEFERYKAPRSERAAQWLNELDFSITRVSVERAAPSWIIAVDEDGMRAGVDGIQGIVTSQFVYIEQQIMTLPQLRLASDVPEDMKVDAYLAVLDLHFQQLGIAEADRMALRTTVLEGSIF